MSKRDGALWFTFDTRYLKRDGPWGENFKFRWLMTYLVANARVTDGVFTWKGILDVPLQRGQFCTSIKGLSDMVDLPRNTVSDCLKVLEKTRHIIVTKPSDDRHYFVIITVCNYDEIVNDEYKSVTNTSEGRPQVRRKSVPEVEVEVEKKIRSSGEVAETSAAADTLPAAPLQNNGGEAGQGDLFHVEPKPSNPAKREVPAHIPWARGVYAFAKAEFITLGGNPDVYPPFNGEAGEVVKVQLKQKSKESGDFRRAAQYLVEMVIRCGNEFQRTGKDFWRPILPGIFSSKRLAETVGNVPIETLPDLETDGMDFQRSNEKYLVQATAKYFNRDLKPTANEQEGVQDVFLPAEATSDQDPDAIKRRADAAEKARMAKIFAERQAPIEARPAGDEA